LGSVINGELEKMWEEAAVDGFRNLSGHLPGGTEENNGKPQSVSRARLESLISGIQVRNFTP
jgi:hypothetical protein